MADNQHVSIKSIMENQEDKKVFLRIDPFDVMIVSKIKEIPGRFWNTQKKSWEIPADQFKTVSRLKWPKKLPVVFSKQEVEAIILSSNNLKHRLLLMMVYSCGLRVSEVVHLKTSDIDWDRNILWVRQGKGKKDRAVMLAANLKMELKKYLPLQRA